MTLYFKAKGTKDFQHSKEFWKFYRTSVKIRSDQSNSNDGPSLIYNNDLPITETSEIAGVFNNFFTTINSISISNQNDSCKFIDDHFNSLKRNKLLETAELGFSFNYISILDIEKVIKELAPNSSPGISGIHPKVLKLIPGILLPL